MDKVVFYEKVGDMYEWDGKVSLICGWELKKCELCSKIKIR